MVIHNFIIEDKIPYSIYANLVKMYEKFEKHNFECYIVGGFIRDIILDKKINFQDIDIATNATPHEVQKIFTKVIPTGMKHGTVTILFKNLKVECTTYRKENKYSDNRHPDSIEFASNIYEDLSRRDFTINAFAYDLKNKILIDVYNGIEDLNRKIIKAIGNTKERFLEDGLRPIRAFRFQSKLDFQLDDSLKKALFDSDVRKSIASISIERFSDELWKAFQAPKTSWMLKGLDDFEILNLFYKNYNKKKISNYFLNYIDHFPSATLKMAMWFSYKEFTLNEVTKLWKFSNKQTLWIQLYTELISYINKYHHYREDNHLTVYYYRKILSLIKQKLEKDSAKFLEDFEFYFIHNLYNVQNNELIFDNKLKEIYKKIIQILERDPLLIKDLKINGEELKKYHFEGKQIGTILHQLHEIVLMDPLKNNKEILLNYLPNLKP